MNTTPPVARPSSPPRRMPPPPPSDPAPYQLEIAKPGTIVSRTFFYAPEKWGKTSLAAFAPNAIMVQVRDTGYQTLLNAGTVPALPTATPTNWIDLLGVCDFFISQPVKGGMLVIDGGTGAERLCHEYVCETRFKGEWGDSGFGAYQKGFDLSVNEWLKFLSRLDEIRDKGMSVLMLGHARIKDFKNPLGPNYDRFEPDMHHKTWGVTAKWADSILFGKFHTIVDQTKRERDKSIAESKGKAVGGIDRVVFTRPCDAWVAGTRFGMESEIWLNGIGPDQMWNTIAAQMTRKENA